MESDMLHFKVIAPQNQWLNDTKKFTRFYEIHTNISCAFEAIDNLFETISQSPNGSIFAKQKGKSKEQKGNEMAEEYTKTFNAEVAELEVLFADSLIIIKTDIINQVMFYSKELGVRVWCDVENELLVFR